MIWDTLQTQYDDADQIRRTYTTSLHLDVRWYTRCPWLRITLHGPEVLAYLQYTTVYMIALQFFASISPSAQKLNVISLHFIQHCSHLCIWSLQTRHDKHRFWWQSLGIRALWAPRTWHQHAKLEHTKWQSDLVKKCSLWAQQQSYWDREVCWRSSCKKMDTSTCSKCSQKTWFWLLDRQSWLHWSLPEWFWRARMESWIQMSSVIQIKVLSLHLWPDVLRCLHWWRVMRWNVWCKKSWTQTWRLWTTSGSEQLDREKTVAFIQIPFTWTKAAGKGWHAGFLWEMSTFLWEGFVLCVVLIAMHVLQEWDKPTVKSMWRPLGSVAQVGSVKILMRFCPMAVPCWNPLFERQIWWFFA